MKINSTLLVAVTVAVLGFASTAVADEQAQKTAAMHELISLTFSKAQWAKLVAGTDAALRAQLPAGQASAISLEDMISYQEMVDFQMGLMSKYYTADEIQQLVAFYRTPVGKKAIQVMPEVMRDVQGMLSTRIQQKLPVMMEKMRAQKDAARPANAAPAK